MRSLKTTLLGALALAPAVALSAQVQITDTNVVGGDVNHDLALLTDGVFPADFTLSTDAQNVWWRTGDGNNPVLYFSFDQAYILEEVVLTADSNDFYQLQISQDSLTWNTLFTLLAFEGDVDTGSETFSSVLGAGNHTVSIDFAPTAARYARLYSVAGSGNFAVGEIQFTGTPVVPEPESLALLVAGAMVAATWARRPGRPSRGRPEQA